MNPHNINHLLELAAASENMPSPGVESRLLATIAAQQKRIEALESTITVMCICVGFALDGSETEKNLQDAIDVGNLALGIEGDETE